MNISVIMLILIGLFTPLTVLLIVPMWFNTYYVLDETGLFIKCGIRKGVTVPYGSILSAVNTKDPLSSAALSLDRIEIKYKLETRKFADILLISPVDKQEFFEQLGAKNGDIKINAETKPMDRVYKAFLTATLGICIVVLLGVVAMMITGEFDPNVTVNENGITISGMYGLHVGAHEITGITLIDESMSDISRGTSTRTNGFGGFGQAQKGHFSSSELGTHLRFVQARTAPTIRIERLTFDIYISLRDSEKTRELFAEMQKLDWTE